MLNYQIKQAAEVTRKIKGSKFIARVYSVDTREAALLIIKNNEQEHHKASHVCWAFRLSQSPDVPGYCSDAGEPHGSAGSPILASLEGRRLVNTLCVVVRYFGGTKLGIGGLIRAYGGVAAEALDQAEKKPFQEMVNLKIRVEQSQYSELMRVFRKYRLSVKPRFEVESVLVFLVLTPRKFESLSAAIQQISSAEIIID